MKCFRTACSRSDRPWTLNVGCCFCHGTIGRGRSAAMNSSMHIRSSILPGPRCCRLFASFGPYDAAMARSAGGGIANRRPGTRWMFRESCVSDVTAARCNVQNSRDKAIPYRQCIRPTGCRLPQQSLSNTAHNARDPNRPSRSQHPKAKPHRTPTTTNRPLTVTTTK